MRPHRRLEAPAGARTPGAADGPVDGGQRAAVQRVVEVLRRDYAQPISLGDMADIAHFSPSYFNQLFCRVTGVPPSRFLTALRLEAAKALLLEPWMRVIDVCYEVGYNSPGTFSSRFTRLVGISPQGFRDLARPDGWLHLDAFLRTRQHLLPAAFRSHKQPAVGVLRMPGETPAAVRGAPVFVGAYRERIPQGAPAAYTIAFASPVYALPRMPDGRYFVFATSFRWSEDFRTYLLLDPRRDDLLVGAGTRPLHVVAGRVRGHVDIQLRRPRATDPPLLSALAHFMHRPGLHTAPTKALRQQRRSR